VPGLQQGSVVWSELPAPFGRRPVVVLTRDAVVGRLNAITVAPITHSVRNIDTEVVLEPADGVWCICAVTLDNIFTIQRTALKDSIVVLNRDKLLLIDSGSV